MSKFALISSLVSGSLLLAGCGGASSVDNAASLDIRDVDGAIVGVLTLTSNDTGGTEVDVKLNNVSDGAGVHAMHFHEVGACDAPSFTSSGGHYNPAVVPHGQHAGDMMNINVNESGSGEFKVTNDRVSISGQGGKPALMDNDGSALIIHAKGDDYTSQPSGAAGPRIACAVIPAG